MYRIAALTTERLNWEDWKKLQKENAAKAAQLAAEEESQMREYRAQLDADRNAKLSKGTNNAHLRAQASIDPNFFSCIREGHMKEGIHC